MRTRTIYLALILLMLFLGMANTASAVPVVSYTNNYDSGTNRWTYEATIFNDTPDLLYDFVIYPTANPIDAADLTLVGWGAAEIGHGAPYFVHWMADFGAEISPGDTMGGFWFTYSGDMAGDIGSLEYEVTLLDSTNLPYVLGGTTVPSSPSTQVPEPGTFILMASGIAGLAALFRRRGGSTWNRWGDTGRPLP